MSKFEVAENYSEQARRSLLKATISIASKLDVAQILNVFITQVRAITDAAFAALILVDIQGEIVAVEADGLPADIPQRLINSLLPSQTLSAMPLAEPLVVSSAEDVAKMPSTIDFGVEQDNYLCLPLPISGDLSGWVYAGNSTKELTPSDTADLRALTSAAASALENARLYAEAKVQQEWITVSQGITTMLLSGAAEEEALQFTVEAIRDVAQAEAVLLILPSLNDQWVGEFYDGPEDFDLRGQVFPPQGRAITSIRTGEGILVDSFANTLHLRIPLLAHFGPGLYAPMCDEDGTKGVFLILRPITAAPFTKTDLRSALSVAAQTSLALELAESKHKAEVATLQAERESIGRDLHDLAIQQLFAAGMQLTSLRDTLDEVVSNLDSELWERLSVDPQRLATEIESAYDAIGDSAQQIRSIVSDLKSNSIESTAERTIIERLTAETSLARASLGFAPTMIVELDGQILDYKKENFDALAESIDNALADEVKRNLIAVLRESLANAAKYSKATSLQVRLSIDQNQGNLILEISDNGKGLPEQLDRESGLENIRKRAEELRGEAVFVSAPGEGLYTVWRVPIH